MILDAAYQQLQIEVYGRITEDDIDFKSIYKEKIMGNFTLLNKEEKN